MKTFFVFIILSLSAVFAKAQNNTIVGVWWNDLFTSRIEIYENNGKLYGKVIWLKEDKNLDGTAPRLDLHNPEEGLRNRKIIGLVILKNLTWDEEYHEWVDGEIYSPAHGKTFSCYAKEIEGDKLYLKGYVLGLSFLGSSTVWTRYKS